MGDRYFLTGVQIGILKACWDCKVKEALRLLDEIEENQFIGRIEEGDKDKLKVGIVEI